MQLNLLSNFFLLFTGLMGLIVIFIILRSIRSNKMANIYLVIFLAFVSIRFILIGYFQFNLTNTHFEPSIEFKTIFLFFVPCFYLYIESLLSERKTFNKKNLYHFILPLTCIAWNLMAASYFSEIPQWIISLNYIYVLGLILFYISNMYILLRKKLWQIKHPNSVANYYILRNWTYFLFGTCVFLGLRIIVSVTYELIYDTSLSGGRYGFFVATIVWFILLIKLLISPEILHGVHHLKKIIQMKDKDVETFPNSWINSKVEVKNEQDLKLKSKIDENLAFLVVDLDNCVKENRVFQNPKFNINDLADQLGIPKSHLVYLFKYHSKLTFSEYKTQQRIVHAIDLIHSGHLNNNTLESLATFVGFASYNPFFTAFKKHTGQAPNEYVTSKTKI